MTLTWYDKAELFPAAVQRLETTPVVLDIGCGIRPQTFITPAVHICCEPFDEYVERLQTMAGQYPDRHFIIQKATWAEAVAMLPPRSVDTVFLVDVIEHLEKEEGRALLEATERIARRQIAIFTPLGFMPQHHEDGKDAWGLGGGAWQEHKSGWLPEDFGDDWDILASEQFHTHDAMGNLCETPYGALWAIKTLTGHSPPVSEEFMAMTLAARRMRQATTRADFNEALVGALEAMFAMNPVLAASDAQRWQIGHLAKQLLALESPRFGNLAIRGMDLALLLEEKLAAGRPAPSDA